MEDAVLVGGLLAGEKSSFDHIYEKYSPELYRTAYLILRNKTDAEDATQDAFIALWQKAGSIKNPESLRYWLLKCVSGKSKDILRKRRKEYPDEDIAALSEADTIGHSLTPAPADEIENKSVINERLAALPYKYREVLVLYYYNELSVSEIANVTGQLKGTVKSRLFHAREKLRMDMEKEDAHE